MKFYIIIPAHNEANFIAYTLESLIKQSLLPKKIVVVNDHSTDNTEHIVQKFTQSYDFISLVNNTSSDKHLPGAKIVNAFYKGYETLDNNYDVICKFDADLIFPNNYLETLAHHFNNNSSLGMAAGFCFIEKDNEWQLENLTRKDHIRGALKAYRKPCFEDIGKLKPSIGWDTVDELLANYYGWTVITDDSLHVKHLKPTGETYNKDSKYAQGEAFYKLRYGFILTILTALKMAFKKRKLSILNTYLRGYFNAKSKGLERLVNDAQGRYIRQLRWKGIFQKFS